MAAKLAGQRVAFLVANEGVEQVELTDPWANPDQVRTDDLPAFVGRVVEVVAARSQPVPR